MVFSALSSTYQLYKQDTDSVAAWLASTAKSLGYSTDLSTSSTTAGTGRLKGKARASAKKGAASPKPSTGAAAPRHVINLNEFVPLAEHIAAKATSVPDTVRTTIDRVIAVRSGFGAKLEKHGKVLSEVSDAKHQYFIGVLEKVRQVLMPLMLVSDMPQDKPTDEKLSNRFAGLAVYEPSQEFLGAPAVERPAKTGGDTVVYEAEIETSFGHAIFALASVINDMNRVRAHVRWIWSNYRIGIFELAAAAIATNTAIDLVRNMMEDILPLLNRNGGLATMLCQLYDLQCLMKGWAIDNVFAEGQDNFNYDTYDIGYETYLTTYRLLESFIDLAQPKDLPLSKKDMFGFYNTASHRSRKTGLQKFEDDRALLLVFFTELMTIIRCVKSWPVKDEFLRGIEELDKTRQVPFYAVFAAQVFLDITYELEEDIQRPFNTMDKHLSAIDNDITVHFEFHAKENINDMLIREVQQAVKWIGKDPLREVRAEMCRRGGVSMPNSESHRLFRMSPVMSGLILYYFRSLHRAIGLGVANALGSIQCCQHLYNALRYEELLNYIWQDMEVITANLGKDSFYVGGEVPKDPRAYFSKFCLQMGTSAAAMTNNKQRKNTPLWSKSGTRGLKAASPVLSMFRARYVQNTGQVDFTPEYVSQIIELSLFEAKGTKEEGPLTMGQIKDPKKLKEKKRLKHLADEGKRRRAKTAIDNGNMPLEQLIEHLVFALDAESIEYAFPYLTMHRGCWRLLRAVKDSCDSCLRQLFTPAYLENESQLPWVVGWILMAARGLEGGVSDRRPLQLAAEAVKCFCDAGTSRLIYEQILGKQLGMRVEFAEEDEDIEL
ncbi:hypothetical protein F5B22DRAFT_634763 [Xylaria bambusicola]|uniref:uncharacterized protein n=1 Tax=Xylaria bambusicola TaxID=326684 RepID=UPI002008A6A9|nr:uncharacterized protein F5B22DRAFT_634763 [Xylaria bambusicola]KAI0521398.1 hypothetical protein F5B22DRAFT_634763 [Xylaria bambusicola]